MQHAGLGRGGLAPMLGHERRGCERVSEGLKVVGELRELVLKARFICFKLPGSVGSLWQPGCPLLWHVMRKKHVEEGSN